MLCRELNDRNAGRPAVKMGNSQIGGDGAQVRHKGQEQVDISLPITLLQQINSLKGPQGPLKVKASPENTELA